MSKKAPQFKSQRLFRGVLWATGLLAVLNLLFSASVVALVGAIVILVMVWGIRRGDYPLTRGLAIFLFIYAAVNLVVLLLVLISGTEARPSALVWLALYSLAMIVLGALLRGPTIQTLLKTLPQPAEKEKKIHFFHGGWRDL